ncbi:MAG: VWA domain-containing protein [Rhodocyclaceae bacterium]
MRRLPVYLLIDTSGSMFGEPIEAVKVGLQTMVSALRTDPYALETVHMSVITFAEKAAQIVPLTELVQFQAPDLQAGGTTALGEALSLLAQCIERDVKRTTADSKGDWKPACFLLTDGQATDDLERGIAALRTARIGTLVACAAGPMANTAELRKITESVISLDTADSNTLKAFFQWVSASVSVSSQKIERTTREVDGLSELPPLPPEINPAL